MLGRALFKGTTNKRQITGVRYLNIHEHESIDLLQKFGVTTPIGKVAFSPQEAKQLYSTLPGEGAFVKAQVLAGGRGKGHFDNGFQGGVKLCLNENEVEEVASKMIGSRLITKQTGEDGRPVEKVFICERRYPEHEYYTSITMDRGLGDARSNFGPVLVSSAAGGMNIEEVAESNPDAIVKKHIDINSGLSMEEAVEIAKKVGFPEVSVKSAAEMYVNLYNMFRSLDCTTVEINPMATDKDGSAIAMDAKVNFDDNAQFRHKEIFNLKDWSQEDPREQVADKADLNYIGLDGSIGCLVNGAGLAMATMDICKLHGGEPANFLDVGGSASTEQVTDAFRLITSDKQVSSIFVNIFGGIMKCDVIAAGIVEAAKTLDLTVPIVVRLQGTNVEAAKEIIDSSGMKIISIDDFDESARTAVLMSKVTSIMKESGLNLTADFIQK